MKFSIVVYTKSCGAKLILVRMCYIRHISTTKSSLCILKLTGATKKLSLQITVCTTLTYRYV